MIKTIAICPKCETFTILEDFVHAHYCMHFKLPVSAITGSESDTMDKNIQRIECKIIRV